MSTGTGPKILDPEHRRIADLASGLRGRVLLPHQDGYDAEIAGFNQCVEHRPALIVAAEGTQDVVAAVRFAADGGLPVAVQATGHGVTSAADGALLINTSRMNELQVHADIRTARIEAGVRWRQVIDAAARFGLAPLNGSAPDVGAVSYTLGGGMGLMARKYGFAADHVRSIDVVTPDGKLRHASHKENADLFWALLGGKGNFGVVVSMQIELLPVSRLYGGALFFDGAKAADVLRTWQVWSEVIPEEMTSSIALMRLPDLPDVPEPIRGRYVVSVRIAYLGSEHQGERLVEPLRGLGPRILDTVTDMPYTEVGSIHSDPEFAAPWIERTAMLHRLDGVAIDTLLDKAGPDSQSGMMVVELRHLGGALRRPPRVPNSVSNRDAAYTLLAVTLAGPDDTARATSEMEQMMNSLGPWGTGGRCLNFLNGPTVAGQAESAYDQGTYRRLCALKAKYDPGNMFRFNVNIPPRVTS